MPPHSTQRRWRPGAGRLALAILIPVAAAAGWLLLQPNSWQR